MKLKLKKMACLAGGAAATALLAHSVQAQTALPEVVIKESAQPADKYEVTESATATKVATQLRNVPQIVNVVPKVVMRDQNALSVQDVLQNVAGLSFSVGDGQRDQVAIRGFTAISDQFIDGVRDDALYFRDLSNIDRIEVLKGPGSVLYGRGSAGGLINRVSKKPNANPVAEVAATLGSEGQKRGEFDIGTASQDKQMQFRLTGALEDSRNFRNQYFLERQAVAPSASFLLQPGTRLTVQADYLKDKRLADQGVPSYKGRPVDVPIETYFGAANGRDRAYVQSEVSSGTATLDHAFSDTLSLHSVLRAYDYSLDRNYTTIGSVSSGAIPTVSIAQARRLRDERGVYLQNELSQKLQWGATRHQILYGVELGQQDKSELLWSRSNVATYNLLNPVLVKLPPLPASLTAGNDNKNRVDIAAVYLQDLATLDSNWKVLGGLRYDHLKQQRDDRTARNLDLQRTDNTLAPRVGLIYQPTEQFSLYAAYSKSFQPLADSFSFRANSDQMKPTQTVNHEVGVKLDVAAKASLTAALFEMSQTNIQVADPANSSYSLPVGKQRTRGVELSFTGEIAPQWELISGYAYMDGKIVESTERTSTGSPFRGKTAALTPKHSFNLWLKRKFSGAYDGYYVAAGGRAESARFASPDDLTVLPGYGVIHVGAGYAAKKFDVSVMLKNLLNRKYYVAAHSGANDYNMPGEPRSVLVTARYRF
ncbi:TonB-dependent siderophore receptor [Undibacterium sp. Jales W-56]|uniref:TonB-dependent receptor n=1 Tax=Undibacterium sp. Jales W-56 TaxID=2897325 RepID=UPI0021CF20C5|nr:TonB-dependent siderophore receptor [Undibacterium sp. Jales W-56]MCU6433561.1 TonB-dependent siderophore receptor [Undibacterium sp. Jales W-56]